MREIGTPDISQAIASLYLTFQLLQHNDGGIGLLVNNVGMANETPRYLEELSSQEIDNMLYCNIFSTMDMTRTVLGFMKKRANGAILNISSGSGNHPGPLLAVYSSTK